MMAKRGRTKYIFWTKKMDCCLNSPIFLASNSDDDEVIGVQITCKSRASYCPFFSLLLLTTTTTVYGVDDKQGKSLFKYVTCRRPKRGPMDGDMLTNHAIVTFNLTGGQVTFLLYPLCIHFQNVKKWIL